MKNVKHLVKFLMIGIALLMIMVACSSGESDTSKEADADTDKGTQEETNTNEEPYEIVMVYPNLSQSVEDLELIQDAISEITKEKINATVKLESVGFGAWAQQYNLMLTSNEKVDLIFSFQGESYVPAASRGAFLPLDELLETHGQGIVQALPENILEGTRVKGEIFGLPSVRDYAAYYGFVMRKDLIEEYDIDLNQVNTFEDLSDVFKTVQENDPDILPIANFGSTITPTRMMILSKYDFMGDRLGVIAYDGDEIVNLFETPEYVETIKLVREWYEAGYIKRDAPTTTDTEIMQNGLGFGSFAGGKPDFEVQESASVGMPMKFLPLTDTFVTSDAAIALNMSIGRTSENPEKAMEFLNLLYTDKDIMNLIALGIEDVHYEVTTERTARLLPNSKYLFNQWQIGNNFLTYPLEGNTANNWEITKAFNNEGIYSPAFGFQFDPSAVSTEIAACTNVLNQYRAALEHGLLDPEKALPEFNDALKAAGLEKIIAEKQRQFDEWKAIN